MAASVATRSPVDSYLSAGFRDAQSWTHDSSDESHEPVTSVQAARAESTGSSHHLEVSFYPGAEHQLDIRTVDRPNLLFARALSILQPLNESYAVTPYARAMNWTDVFTYLKKLCDEVGYVWTEHEFYVVEFRSKLQQDIDRELLFKLDKESHREATQSGGLLKYWYGSPDADRRNLATCLWRSKEDAIEGGKGIWHKQARSIISQMYEEINVKGLRLKVDNGVSGWSFEPFSFH